MEHHGNDVWGGGYVDARHNSRTIPTVGSLQSGSLLFLLKRLLLPPELFRTQIVVKLLKLEKLFNLNVY